MPPFAFLSVLDQQPRFLCPIFFRSEETHSTRIDQDSCIMCKTVTKFQNFVCTYIPAVSFPFVFTSGLSSHPISNFACSPSLHLKRSSSPTHTHTHIHACVAFFCDFSFFPVSRLLLPMFSRMSSVFCRMMNITSMKINNTWH